MRAKKRENLLQEDVVIGGQFSERKSKRIGENCREHVIERGLMERERVELRS